MKDNKTYYDDFAGWYERERHGGYHALIDQLQVELVQERCAGKEVLEVGCGTGMILREIDPVAERAVGIDISAGMLEQAKARGLEVLEGSATDLPFEDNSFDVVYSFKVLAHVEEIERALSEVYDPREGEVDPTLHAAARAAKKARIGPWGPDDVDYPTRQKQLAKLARRGFSYQVAQRVLRADLEEAEQWLHANL